MIQINVSAPNQKISRLIDPAKIRNAMKSASQSAIHGVKSEIDSGIKSQFNLERDPKNHSILTKASVHEARVDIKGTRIPLINFKHSNTAYLTYSVRRGENRGNSRAFLAGMNSGHRGIFVRVGKSRLPIRELFGASYPEMATKYEVRDSIIQKMFNRYQNEMVKFL